MWNFHVYSRKEKNKVLKQFLLILHLNNTAFKCCLGGFYNLCLEATEAVVRHW